MKQIFAEIASIDQGMISLQDFLLRIDTFKSQSEKDIVDKRKKAEQAYLQSIEQIENSCKQVEANHSQAIANCRQKRNDIESSSQNNFSNFERRIRSNCDTIVQRNKKTIAWIENAIAEMPPKLVKKVVSGPTIVPCAIETSMLEDLYNKIFDGSFQAGVNRAFHIDGYSPKAKMVQEFLQNAIAYKLFLENEIKAATSRKSDDISREHQRVLLQKQRDLEAVASQEKRANDERARLLQELDKKRSAAANTKSTALSSIDQLKKKYDSDLVNKRNDFTKKFNAFMNSELVVQFVERVKKRLVGTGAMDLDWTSYSPKGSYPQYYIGDFLKPIKTTDQRLVTSLQSKLPKFRNGLFRIPLLLQSEEAGQFFVQYRNSDKKLICEFVQCIILQKLRCAKAGNIEVYFAEPDKSGQILGPLSAPIQDNELIGIYNINSRDSIKKALKKFSDDIDEINGLLGDYRNIYEYNKDRAPQLKEKCLVLSDVGGIIDKEDWDLLKTIWNNGPKCGITIVIVSSYSIDSIPSLYPHTDIDISYLRSKELYLINCANNKATVKHGQAEFGFFMSKMTDECKAFVNKYRTAAIDSQKVDSRFASHFDATKAYPYRDSTKALSLPIMLRNYPGGGQFEFVMDSKTKAHTLLTGGTGSGKTTFLYMLISSIVMNYHPDDVELWLVDYGRVSFKRYVDKRPKHVRFVSLEKTDTFTYSFLEYVDDYFSNRARLFKNDNVDSLAAYRDLHGKLSMPRIVLIIDEFHVMPQHAKESPAHNKILENILREYRKYGLSCIFSDQTRNTGLTSDGEKQIANRLAMRQNNINDIIETIDVAKDNYTDKMLRQMERTQQGELWAKAFCGDSESDFDIEYFKAIYANEDEQQQVLETSLRRNDDVKCDTKVYIVDGEERAMVSLDGMSSALSNSDVAEPTFCMGVPTSIEPFFSFKLEQRYGNNILVAGRNSKIGNDLIAELLLSTALKENVRTIVFADSREKKLSEVRTILDEALYTLNRLRFRNNGIDITADPNNAEGLFACNNSVEVYTDYKSVCRLVREFSDQIKRREAFDRPTVILWLGMLDIYDELSVYKSYQEEAEIKQDGFEVSNEKSNLACQDEELIAMAAQLGVGVEEILQSLGKASEETSKKEDEDGCVYNAVPDINSLLSLGGRYSLYSIVPLESSSDIKRLKDFKIDNFVHRIGYAMSSEDSWEFGFGKRASSIPDDDMALYTNGIKNNMFRPFLLK